MSGRTSSSRVSRASGSSSLSDCGGRSVTWAAAVALVTRSAMLRYSFALSPSTNCTGPQASESLTSVRLPPGAGDFGRRK